ncbi:MAG: hypothetical protein CR988_05655 [Treponema sp.]|nr:MAG: hypothetical protein CR988_05655 [Treponema sp.]
MSPPRLQKIAFFQVLNYIESSSRQPRLLKNLSKAIVFPLPPYFKRTLNKKTTKIFFYKFCKIGMLAVDELLK